ncbi:hypothetical protein [Tenacibaculum maritimum]|uniref:hypothetical protein n=2 Tax=Tenacibaculum maritimum TaxID=107401 RepID=UPI003875E90E
MKLDLSNKKLTGVIAFIKFKSESFYCMADVEYWLGDSWFLYLEDKSNVEEKYFEYIKKEFRVDCSDLQLYFSDVFKSGDEYDIAYRKPLLYIDFEERLFVSYYYEQDLEDRVLDNWTGKYSEVYDLIPKEYRYWESIQNIKSES